MVQHDPFVFFHWRAWQENWTKPLSVVLAMWDLPPASWKRRINLACSWGGKRPDGKRVGMTRQRVERVWGDGLLYVRSSTSFSSHCFWWQKVPVAFQRQMCLFFSLHYPFLNSSSPASDLLTVSRSLLHFDLLASCLALQSLPCLCPHITLHCLLHVMIHFVGLKWLLFSLSEVYCHIQAGIPLLTTVCGHVMQLLWFVSNVIHCCCVVQ